MSELAYLNQELAEVRTYMKQVKHSTNKKLFAEAQEEERILESLINSLR